MNSITKNSAWIRLLLRYVLNENPANSDEKEWQDKIVFATQEDIPKWMELVFLIGTAYDKSNIFFLA